MPYRVGARGSYGCSGYPAVKDDGTVMGCHKTRSEAAGQIYAINRSEGNIDKRYTVQEGFPGCDGYAVVDEDGELDRCFDTIEAARAYANAENMNDVDEADEEYADVGTDANNTIVSKDEHMMIQEGDYVMGMTSEGIAHGRVEHIMWEGGVLGEEGTEYALRSMPPENPAMSVRIYEQEDEGYWEPTAYSIGMMYQDARKLPSLEGHSMPESMSDEMLDMNKAETFTPNAGMKAAAARAIRWKEEGKATGAGTPVGWGRARDIVAGRSMSLSVVRRMFSFFSRHEVDKKGKDFYNTSNPSNGRIMWDAWGGDAGFTWSRGIVNRMRDKALFADFGKDYTKAQPVELFKAKSVSVGDHVMFGVPKPPAATEYAHGVVERVERSGKVTIGNESVEASADNPVAVVRVWAKQEGGGYTRTDRRVAKPFSSLRMSSEPLKSMHMDEEEHMEKVSAQVESRLRELAENYNKGKEGNNRITVGALRQVYNRGIGAYRTNPGSVRGTVSSAEQWAMGRVNAFMAGLRGRFPRKPFDLDLFPSGHSRSTKKTFLDDFFGF